MSWDVNLGSSRYKELFGLMEYYDAIFNRIGLIKKESEFRSTKLSLVLDLIRIIGISDNLGTDLTSKIIDAWRLHVPEKTLIQREDELRTVLSSIRNIKGAIRKNNKCDGRVAKMQFDAVILSYLPITPSDFLSDDAPKIYDLMSQIAEQSLSLLGDKLSLRSEDIALDPISAVLDN